MCCFSSLQSCHGEDDDDDDEGGDEGAAASLQVSGTRLCHVTTL